MRISYFYIFLFISQFSLNSHEQKYPQKMVISVPVADLRNAPEKVASSVKLPTSMETNPLQASQLLFGEYILAKREIITSKLEHWLEVNALQQERYCSKLGWHGFPGWIQKDQAIEVLSYPKNNLIVKKQLATLINLDGTKLYEISIGTRLNGTKQNDNFWEILLPDGKYALINNDDVNEISEIINESISTIRKNIIKTAKQFLGNPYSWGGRSSQNDNFIISSVDCSSLTQLVFLTNGFQIPRNAHGQFLKSNKIIFGKDLQPGDLVFFDPVDRKIDHQIKVSHVLLYIGNEKLLECCQSGEKNVRIITFEERIGIKRSKMTAGDISNKITTQGKVGAPYHIYFGSFCNDKKLLQNLRKNALKNS
jgi:hypothetical protein